MSKFWKVVIIVGILGLAVIAGCGVLCAAPILENNPEIYFAGFLSDARKEYTEGIAYLGPQGPDALADLFGGRCQ